MLTVKVHQTIPGTSRRHEEIFAAYRVASLYEQNDSEEDCQFIHVHTCNDDCYKFEIKEGIRIYVENLAKETVQIYKVDFKTKEA